MWDRWDEGSRVSRAVPTRLIVIRDDRRDRVTSAQWSEVAIAASTATAIATAATTGAATAITTFTIGVAAAASSAQTTGMPSAMDGTSADEPDEGRRAGRGMGAVV